MSNDFYVAFLSGWSVLLVFWSTIIIFVYIRKPPNSRLTKEFAVSSYLIFLILLVFILIFRYVDSLF